MATTRDTLWNGRLVFAQPARGEGYRFNLDPVLLSGFASGGEHLIDLGTGVGVVGILMLASGKAQRVTAVELQPVLARLASENACVNGYDQTRMQVVVDDLRQVSPPIADAVVFNPPYYRAADGRGAQQPSCDMAKHERQGTLADFVAFARRAVRRGFVAAIVPSRRGLELEQLLRIGTPVGLRRRLVAPRPLADPSHCLLEARYDYSTRDDVVVVDEPPLYVHGASGREYSTEVKQWLGEE